MRKLIFIILSVFLGSVFFSFSSALQKSTYNGYTFLKYIYSPDYSYLLIWVKKDWKYNLLINWKEAWLYDMLYDVDVSPNFKKAWFVALKNKKLLVWFITNTWSIVEEYLNYSSWVNSSKNLNKWFKISPYWNSYVLKIWKNWKDVLVIDGKESEEFDSIASPKFYKDKITFLWEKDWKKYIVFDDWTKIEDDEQLYINQVYSPDTQRIATVVKRDWWYIVNVDNNVSKVYSTDQYIYPVFSYDSKSYAYIASKTKKNFVVVKDGKEVWFGDIEANTLKFSPDSKHYAYITKNGFKWTIVKDNVNVSISDSLISDYLFCENWEIYYTTSTWKIYKENNDKPLYEVEFEKYPNGIRNLSCIDNVVYVSLWIDYLKNFVLNSNNGLYGNINGIYWVWKNSKWLILVWDYYWKTLLASDYVDDSNIDKKKSINPKIKVYWDIIWKKIDILTKWDPIKKRKIKNSLFMQINKKIKEWKTIYSDLKDYLELTVFN